MNVGQNIAAVRQERGLSQTGFARRAGLSRPHVAFFESGTRIPSLKQLLAIAAAFDVSLQRLLHGSDRQGELLADIAVELRGLGLIDLWVSDANVPAVFRPTEDLLALAVSGNEPAPRILEGVPALLAWNRWSDTLLLAFARSKGRATVFRLAWLADIALAIERRGGFPGGCPAKKNLAAYVQRVKAPPGARWDSVGSSGDENAKSPIWRRWRISYPADLDTFRNRASSLVMMAQAEGRLLATGAGHGKQ